MRYAAEGTPLLILAGKEYGSGSSRDWAAKGTRLLGVRAVLAESYERIHRSNLVGMGVLPLQYLPGENATTLGLDGREAFDIVGLAEDLRPRAIVRVTATSPGGTRAFEAVGTARRADRGGLLPPGRDPAGGPAAFGGRVAQVRKG